MRRVSREPQHRFACREESVAGCGRNARRISVQLPSQKKHEKRRAPVHQKKPDVNSRGRFSKYAQDRRIPQIGSGQFQVVRKLVGGCPEEISWPAYAYSPSSRSSGMSRSRQRIPAKRNSTTKTSANASQRGLRFCDRCSTKSLASAVSLSWLSENDFRSAISVMFRRWLLPPVRPAWSE